jgi:hypothetical protein
MKAKTQNREKRKSPPSIAEAFLDSLTPEIKDAVEAMNRVETSKVKQKPYKLPIFRYVRCDM